jgi:maleylacetate reductase
MWEVKFYDTKIIYGENSLSYLENIDLKDPIIVTTSSLMNSEVLSKVIKYSKSRKVIGGPSQHTPEEELIQLKGELKGHSEIISLGGGSIIDAVKALMPEFHIAIPTTLSGAEHTAIAGYTKDGIKTSIKTRPPNIIILDPYALKNTPRRLLFTSAFRALDHAIEAIYSKRATLFTDALATQGYKYITQCLRNNDLLKCQIGTWLSSLAFMYAGRGLSHIFGYIFGPKFNIPHGVTSCISLPEAIKFNYPIAGEKLKILEDDVYNRIITLLNELGIRESLSKYVSLEEALKYAKLLKDMVNNSENPREMSYEDAENFIKLLF